MPSGLPFSIRLQRRPGFEVALLAAVADGAAFPKHTHDEYVVSANLSGAEWIWLDRRSYEAGTGDVTAYNPGALQASRGRASADAAWSFVSLYAEPGFAADALGLPAPPTLPQPVLVDPRAATALLTLARCAREDASSPPGLLDEAAVETLGAVARPAQAVERPDAGNAALRRVAEHLLDRLADPPDLATLAREAGLSREHLVRRFSARFGLPPMAWAQQRRLARARGMLRAGLAPAAVAAALGFADQAHLTRAFRSTAGITPGRYRRGR
jgi:AraC family chemosensory pili system transcriptional regulator ChpD